MQGNLTQGDSGGWGGEAKKSLRDNHWGPLFPRTEELILRALALKRQEKGPSVP